MFTDYFSHFLGGDTRKSHRFCAYRGTEAQDHFSDPSQDLQAEVDWAIDKLLERKHLPEHLRETIGGFRVAIQKVVIGLDKTNQ